MAKFVAICFTPYTIRSFVWTRRAYIHFTDPGASPIVWTNQKKLDWLTRGLGNKRSTTVAVRATRRSV